MPSVAENQVRWTEYPWEHEGHEWSPGGTAVGGEMFWWRGLLPRLHTHLPASRVLEIGPGFGRWTSHLESYAERLILVDLTERCIEHCRRRFADRNHIDYWMNDGQSLEMVEDGSLDFVFSFDSLIHAEAPVLRRYLAEIERKLRPGGTGFIHHSNLAALANQDGTFPSWVTRKHWRGETMSARLFREYCREAGLTCATQEVINWVGRRRKADRHRIYGTGIPMTDVLSSFRKGQHPRKPTKIYVNPLFVHEWRQCTVLATVYGGDEAREKEGAPGAGVPEIEPGTAQRRIRALVRTVRQRIARLRDNVASRSQDRFVAREVRHYEPILNALLSRRCPDCHCSLTLSHCCSRCHAQFYFPMPR